MTDKAMRTILSSMTVIIDSREHADGNCSKIIEYLDSAGIKHARRKLEFADYSFDVCGKSYENKIAVERKASLDELSGNVAQSRERFERELERSKIAGAKLILMCENGSWDGIIEHKYRTDLNPKSFMASLLSFQSRYGIDIQFIPAKYAGMFIYGQFYYFLRQELKQMEVPA